MTVIAIDRLLAQHLPLSTNFHLNFGSFFSVSEFAILSNEGYVSRVCYDMGAVDKIISFPGDHSIRFCTKQTQTPKQRNSH